MAQSVRKNTERSPSRPVAPQESAAPPDFGSHHATTAIDAEHRRAMIAEAAYYRSEQHCAAPHAEIEDWLAAELEVDSKLMTP